jgi:hypothetical protein
MRIINLANPVPLDTGRQFVDFSQTILSGLIFRRLQLIQSESCDGAVESLPAEDVGE